MNKHKQCKEKGLAEKKSVQGFYLMLCKNEKPCKHKVELKLDGKFCGHPKLEEISGEN